MTSKIHRGLLNSKIGGEAPVAQRIEHLATDQKVRGSSPLGRAIKNPLFVRGFSFFSGMWMLVVNPIRRGSTYFVPIGVRLTPLRCVLKKV